MYAIYRCDRRIPELVAVCYTKIGTKRACAHFRRTIKRETCREIEVRYEPIMTYTTARMGYAMLLADRKRQQSKLLRLEAKEAQAQLASLHQRKKVASLY
jgi:hypothetical protein